MNDVTWTVARHVGAATDRVLIFSRSLSTLVEDARRSSREVWEDVRGLRPYAQSFLALALMGSLCLLVRTEIRRTAMEVEANLAREEYLLELLRELGTDGAFGESVPAMESLERQLGIGGSQEARGEAGGERR